MLEAAEGGLRSPKVFQVLEVGQGEGLDAVVGGAARAIEVLGQHRRLQPCED